jgi:hypothetical protein
MCFESSSFSVAPLVGEEGHRKVEASAVSLANHVSFAKSRGAELAVSR